MWINHLTIGVAAISLLVAFAFGGGFGTRITRKRVERKEQETRTRIEQIEQETRNRIERVEQEARNRVEHAENRMKDAEQQRDFAEQLVHDLLNETVDKKYVQAKIALLVAAKGVSNGAGEIADLAKTGFRELRSRVSFWEKESRPETPRP